MYSLYTFLAKYKYIGLSMRRSRRRAIIFKSNNVSFTDSQQKILFSPLPDCPMNNHLDSHANILQEWQVMTPQLS